MTFEKNPFKFSSQNIKPLNFLTFLSELDNVIKLHPSVTSVFNFGGGCLLMK